MGTKCTVKRTEKPQMQDPETEGEFLMWDNSVTVAGISCDSASGLAHGTDHSEEV